MSSSPQGRGLGGVLAPPIKFLIFLVQKSAFWYHLISSLFAQPNWLALKLAQIFSRLLCILNSSDIYDKSIVYRAFVDHVITRNAIFYRTTCLLTKSIKQNFSIRSTFLLGKLRTILHAYPNVLRRVVDRPANSAATSSTSTQSTLSLYTLQTAAEFSLT